MPQAQRRGVEDQSSEALALRAFSSLAPLSWGTKASEASTPDPDPGGLASQSLSGARLIQGLGSHSKGEARGQWKPCMWVSPLVSAGSGESFPPGKVRKRKKTISTGRKRKNFTEPASVWGQNQQDWRQDRPWCRTCSMLEELCEA